MNTTPDKKLLANIKLLISDVDGVMTDRKLILDKNLLDSSRMFNAFDGIGLRMLQNTEIQVAIISGNRQHGAEERFKKLGVENQFYGVDKKLDVVKSIQKKLNVSTEQVCFLGDDVQDYASLNYCGLAAAPADADPQILKLVADKGHWIGTRNGGDGIFRELSDTLLHARDMYWQRLKELEWV